MRERDDSDEEAVEWVHESMDGWGDEVITGPFGAGDAQPKCTEKEDMNLSRSVKTSLCQTRGNETEIESSSDRSMTEEQITEKEEMNPEKLNAARRSAEVGLRRVEQKC